MSIEHFLTENNMEENMKIVYEEFLKNRENIIETYHEKLVGKVIKEYAKEIEDNGFEFH